jgi:hypothetical protein
MDLHRRSVDVRLQRIKAVGQIGKLKRHVVLLD